MCSPIYLFHLEGFWKEKFPVIGRTSFCIWGRGTVRPVSVPLSPSLLFLISSQAGKEYKRPAKLPCCKLGMRLCSASGMGSGEPNKSLLCPLCALQGLPLSVQCVPRQEKREFKPVCLHQEKILGADVMVPFVLSVGQALGKCGS